MGKEIKKLRQYYYSGVNELISENSLIIIKIDFLNLIEGKNTMRIPGVLLRSWIFLKITDLFFSCAGLLMPGKRLGETPNWMAVHHPKPAYPVHILLIPKKAISDWLSFPTDEAEMFPEFVELTQRLIREEGLATKGYRLIINGGEFQSIPQLHVHLVSGEQESGN